MKEKQLNTPISFPNTLPEGYYYLEDEPTYDSNIHLELELPKKSLSLADLGYTKDAVSYTHLRAHETPEHLVCRLLLEKKKKHITKTPVKYENKKMLINN